MSLKKGYLRESLLKPDRKEWLYAVVLFMVSSLLFHMLIMLGYEHALYVFTDYFTAQYKQVNDEIGLYTEFIAVFNCITGLNFAFAFLLRNHLAGRPGKERFGFRLAYHYTQFNGWGYTAWFIRLMYHMVFISLILMADLNLTADFNMKFVCYILLLSYFFNTWLMAHHVLKKAYFKYLRGSLLLIFFALLLIKVKPINYSFYNQAVKKKSVYSEGEFNIPSAEVVQFSGTASVDLNLFMLGSDNDTLPRIRVRGWTVRLDSSVTSMDFVNVAQLKRLMPEPGSVTTAYVNEDVSIGQIWRLEAALKPESGQQYIYFKAAATFEPWAHQYFDYRWYTEAHFLGNCELTESGSLERKACLGRINPNDEHVLHISLAKGLIAINGQALNGDMLEYILNKHYQTHKGASIILFDTDPEITFTEYTSFKDQVKMYITAMRNDHMQQEFNSSYNFDPFYYDHEKGSPEMKMAEALYPMAIINYDREQGVMYSDNLRATRWD